MDIFDEVIMCKKCKKQMVPIHVEKNGMVIRTLECSKCGKRIYHPADVEEYKKFRQLRQKPFSVKLRIVGNSYAVSIPREIINFMKEQDRAHEEFHRRVRRMQNGIVKMMMEDFGKLSLFFDEKECRERGANPEHEKINKDKIKEKRKHGTSTKD